MDMKEFDKYTAIVLRAMDDETSYEYCGTERALARNVLISARIKVCAEEIRRTARYEEYLRLKAEFEPTTKGE